LNDSEFLVTVTNAGRVAQGVYFYDAKTGSYDFPDGAYRANIEVKTEFLGPKGKRFVLLSTSNLHAGNWDSGFEILFLIPRRNGRSFVLQQLLFANEDPESGLCGRRITEGSASSILGYEVLDEGTEKTRLIFNVEEQNCVTGDKQIYKRVFQPSTRGFAEVVGKVHK
jgi:hypothetical protein